MDVQLGDILVMKKEHPCGEKHWLHGDGFSPALHGLRT